MNASLLATYLYSHWIIPPFPIRSSHVIPYCIVLSLDIFSPSGSLYFFFAAPPRPSTSLLRFFLFSLFSSLQYSRVFLFHSLFHSSFCAFAGPWQIVQRQLLLHPSSILFCPYYHHIQTRRAWPTAPPPSFFFPGGYRRVSVPLDGLSFVWDNVQSFCAPRLNILPELLLLFSALR